MTGTIQPSIYRETSNGFLTYSLQDEMLMHREVECVGEIDADMAHTLTRQLRYLQRQDPNAEITLIIDSPGGEVNAGLSIYDVMCGLSCPIRTVCLSTAASMASVLFAAGTKREMLPHSRIMIHDPRMMQGPGGTALEIEQLSRNILRCRDNMADILAACTGKTRAQILKKTTTDCWFTPPEAIEFGLADSVIHSI